MRCRGTRVYSSRSFLTVIGGEKTHSYGRPVPEPRQDPWLARRHLVGCPTRPHAPVARAQAGGPRRALGGTSARSQRASPLHFTLLVLRSAQSAQ